MADSNLTEHFSTAFSERADRAEALLSILTASDDLVAIALKGHLLIEDQLRATMAACCPEADHLERAQLRYVQLVHLLRALGRIAFAPPNLWEALLHLNRLRNDLAHNLDSKDTKRLVKNFVGALAKGEIGNHIPRPHDSNEALVHALHALLGILDVATSFQEGIEALMPTPED